MTEFFSLLRFALNISENFVPTLSDKEWNEIFKQSFRQSLVGIMFDGVKKLDKKQSPPFNLVMQWTALSEKISGMNKSFNLEAKRLTELFASRGIRSVILKGQANAMLYPNKFSRLPGDIDIYLEGGKQYILNVLKEMDLLDESYDETYHHVHLKHNDFGINVDVEVHYRPSSGFYNYFTNNRLQKFLNENLKKLQLSEDGFYYPSKKFALAMQLSHIQKHLFIGGIGLRQIIDYYFLLKNSTEDDRLTIREWLERVGLINFTKALMWVLKKMFMLREEYLLETPNEKLGKTLLNIILNGGNFGLYNAWEYEPNIVKRAFYRQVNKFKLFAFNPGEYFWMQCYYWTNVLKKLPNRIRNKTWIDTDLKQQNEQNNAKN